MRSQNVNLNITLLKSMVHELEANPIVCDFTTTDIVETLLDWQLDCLEEDMEEIKLLFEPEMLDWFVSHINTLDLLFPKTSFEVVKILKFRWDDSNYEDEVDLPALYETIQSLTTRQKRTLSWYCSKK